MGCWNGTCGISHLPIKDGEKIYAYIIRSKQSLDNTYCEITDYGKPICFPLIGNYNDYGCIENIEGCETTVSHILEIFKEKDDLLWQREVPNFEDISSVLNCIERGLSDTYNNYYLFFILKDVADAIIGKYQYDYSLQEEYYKKFSDLCKKLDSMDYEVFSNARKELYNLSDVCRCIRYKDKREILFSRSFDFDCGDIYTLKYILEDTSEKTIRSVCNDHIIKGFMDNTRHGFFKMPGDGSQSENYEDYLFLNDLIKEHCEQKLAEYED